MKYLAIILLAFASTACASTPWEGYLDYPISSNAAQVDAMTYSTPLRGGYDSDDLQILRLQIQAGDTEAFQLGYRLYVRADGGLAEELGDILAKTIRVNPRFFLEQVSALKLQCSALHWVLNVPGPEYVDRPAAQAYEIRMRIKAFRGVTDKTLAKVREQCLDEIDAPRVAPAG